MAKVTDRSALEKMVRARTNLLVSNGFFGFLAMHLKLVECTEINGCPIDTMAVDGVHLFYNPKFVHKLSEQEVEGVEAHEVMHCCFQHFGRRGDRDPFIWNIAGDHVINLDLESSGFTLPKPNCCNPKYKGWTTEEVYDDLIKDAIQITITFGAGGDPGGCGGVLDSPGDTTKQDSVKHGWETSVRAAVQIAQSNNAGNLPASLQSLVAQLQAPKVSWRDLTLRFIDQSMSKDISWSRINRRSTALGTLMPGYISDRLVKLVCFVDTSGSIPQKMVVEMLSEINGAMDQGTADMVVVAYADTRVQHVDEFVQGDLITAGQYTGGGTDFRDSFNWLKGNHPDASCVIYLTDLQVNEFGDDPGCPVMWAVWGPSTAYHHLADRVPFGTGVHVSEGY